MLFNTRTHRRNGPSAASGRVYENEHHNLQEYTYKKITPCDVCSQVLRGMFYANILPKFCIYFTRLLVTFCTEPSIALNKFSAFLLRRTYSTGSSVSNLQAQCSRWLRVTAAKMSGQAEAVTSPEKYFGNRESYRRRGRKWVILWFFYITPKQ